ncbi:NAD-dependent epimerase/dehydratase family protein [Oceanicaulis alexandrii]|uniref:NAD-dependent epimerase/dehydratase family protein n=1 Tax=Oceanicaulis alexandrii TaxID=153233 RepID=UPI0003B33493|nr:NAD-dependent epimerase/dehydratase family protein [Oceanicaulis alexandrii]
MRILITGATGYIGRALLPSLSRSGHVLRCVVRDPSQTLASADEHVVLPDLFTASDGELRAALNGIDLVIHLAWYVDARDYLHALDNLVCVSGTLRLAHEALELGISRFVGVGTCLEYDANYGYLTPQTPLAPVSVYACAKAGVYQTLLAAYERADSDFAWARLFHIYGGQEDPRRLTPYLRARLAAGQVAELTSGRQIRDYMHVDAVGEQLSRFALSETSGAANICSGDPVTVANFAQRIAAEYGRDDLLRFGARPDRPDDPACLVGEPWSAAPAIGDSRS